jgi:hypothetical protein
MRQEKRFPVILVSGILIVTLLFGVTPVFASDGTPPPDQNTRQSDDFWGFLTHFSLSDLLESIFNLLDNNDESLNEMMINSKFSDEEKAEISKYSDGKSPAEMTAQFCKDSSSEDAQAMINDIRRSYAGTESDPHSPVHLMDIFDKMSSFCK